MMNNEDKPNEASVEPETEQQRSPWQMPSMTRFPAADAQTTGGFVNETGFS